jgi:hypothetical protein
VVSQSRYASTRRQDGARHRICRRRELLPATVSLDKCSIRVPGRIAPSNLYFRQPCPSSMLKVIAPSSPFVARMRAASERSNSAELLSSRRPVLRARRAHPHAHARGSGATLAPLWPRRFARGERRAPLTQLRRMPPTPARAHLPQSSHAGPAPGAASCTRSPAVPVYDAYLRELGGDPNAAL